jgi:hypothetical protein
MRLASESIPVPETAPVPACMRHGSAHQFHFTAFPKRSYWYRSQVTSALNTLSELLNTMLCGLNQYNSLLRVKRAYQCELVGAGVSNNYVSRNTLARAPYGEYSGSVENASLQLF